MMAQIFKPLRGQHADVPEMQSLAFDPQAGFGATRVGIQPVTNTSPSGTPKDARTLQEEGWMALLEMVFEVTGWPDAE